MFLIAVYIYTVRYFANGKSPSERKSTAISGLPIIMKLFTSARLYTILYIHSTQTTSYKIIRKAPTINLIYIGCRTHTYIHMTHVRMFIYMQMSEAFKTQNVLIKPSYVKTSQKASKPSTRPRDAFLMATEDTCIIFLIASGPDNKLEDQTRTASVEPVLCENSKVRDLAKPRV